LRRCSIKEEGGWGRGGVTGVGLGGGGGRAALGRLAAGRRAGGLCLGRGADLWEAGTLARGDLGLPARGLSWGGGGGGLFLRATRIASRDVGGT
jgi:hypothetical protein